MDAKFTGITLALTCACIIAIALGIVNQRKVSILERHYRESVTSSVGDKPSSYFSAYADSVYYSDYQLADFPEPRWKRLSEYATKRKALAFRSGQTSLEASKYSHQWLPPFLVTNQDTLIEVEGMKWVLPKPAQNGFSLVVRGHVWDKSLSFYWDKPAKQDLRWK